MRPMRVRTPIQVWCVPTALALISVVGLVGALLGDGLWDALSWLALGVPLAVVAYFSRPPKG